jgi:catechol 2,3-dioxygenase-like lactoylglutathione lyase family enzyme
MTRTIPALPVRDLAAALAYYVERFGFDSPYQERGFAVLRRDDAVLHLWAASDEEWRSRTDFGTEPVSSGAESFIAGTASCRIEVSAVDALFDELRSQEVLHRLSRDGMTETDFGTREFATLDLDGNLLTFFRWKDR